MSSMKNHTVKCTHKNFVAIEDGRKTSDIRYNDRGYEIGDSIEYVDNDNGKRISAFISFMDDFGCQFNYVNLSLARVGLLNALL